jgi:hypothetical protein
MEKHEFHELQLIRKRLGWIIALLILIVVGIGEIVTL